MRRGSRWCAAPRGCLGSDHRHIPACRFRL